MPGTSLMVNRLAKYVQECDPESVVLHLVDHSAGSGSPIVDMLQADGWRAVVPVSDQVNQPDPKPSWSHLKVAVYNLPYITSISTGQLGVVLELMF